MTAPTVPSVQMNLQTVCRGRTQGTFSCGFAAIHLGTPYGIDCTDRKIFPRVDHSWSIFRTIRGIDKNENRTTVLPFRMVRAYSHAHRFFSPGKRDFLSGKRHFSSGKSIEQRRAEDRTEEQRRAEHSREQQSRQNVEGFWLT